jgi:hypothetical protein
MCIQSRSGWLARAEHTLGAFSVPHLPLPWGRPGFIWVQKEPVEMRWDLNGSLLRLHSSLETGVDARLEGTSVDCGASVHSCGRTRGSVRRSCDGWRAGGCLVSSRSRRGLGLRALLGARMALQDWGLTPVRLIALSPEERADYESAIAEYEAAVREVGMPWMYFSGLPAPPPAEGIRALARAIREVHHEREHPPRLQDEPDVC